MAFEQLKEKQSVMWGSGPFERIEEIIFELHDVLVERLAPRPGERWLDVGCGTGAVAMHAARAGADVTGVDLAPDLIATAKRRSAAEGLDVAWEVGDCENLRFDDGSFDVVASSVGFTFAPDHRATAEELARVTRQGGRIGFTAWKPDGGIGDLFRMMGPYSPSPPEGVGKMVDWGREDHVDQLLGDAFDLSFEDHDSPWQIGSGEEAWELFVESYGPTKSVAAGLSPERREELHRDFVALHERSPGNGGFSFSRTFLLVVGTRR